MTFEWLGYLGVFFAAVYRIPQIIKLYRSKKGADVSKKSFILHNGAYISLILYLSLSKKQNGLYPYWILLHRVNPKCAYYCYETILQKI